MVSFAHVRTQAHDFFISQAGTARRRCGKNEKRGENAVLL